MQTNKKTVWYKRTTILLTITTLISTSLLLMSQSAPIDSQSAPIDIQANMPPDNPKSQLIDVENASKFVTNYNDKAEKVKAVVKGIIIEDGQLEALNNVAAAHPGSKSYRLYFATDNSGTPKSIAVAMDNEGNDETDNMYSTERTGTNLCPPMCDASGTVGGK